MHLPVAIPEYTDFFCSLEHCNNVGYCHDEFHESQLIPSVRTHDQVQYTGEFLSRSIRVQWPCIKRHPVTIFGPSTKRRILEPCNEGRKEGAHLWSVSIPGL